MHTFLVVLFSILPNLHNRANAYVTIFSNDLSQFELFIDGRRVNKVPSHIVIAEKVRYDDVTVKVVLANGDTIQNRIHINNDITLRLVKSFRGISYLMPVVVSAQK